MPAATTSVNGYLTSTDWNTFNNKGSGTVTSVSATAPITSSGGATPNLAMPAATTSVNGYLTSTDWTTFNNKGSGTVTSVAALTLGTSGTDLSSTVATGTTTPVITLQVPTASATNRGALSAADWTTFNNKGSGTVTSVTGTAPVVSSGGNTPAISMAAATTSVSGYLTSTDWTTFNGKQAALVSGTNIKTVSGTSLLGSGDLGLIGATYGGTGVNNGSNTITVAGNLTHAGAFTQSFTASANTAVTLPAGATAASNNLLSSATAVGIVTGTPSSSTYLRGDGTWSGVSAITQGTAQSSTSGTSIDFTGIPSSAKRITVMFSGTSTNGVSPLMLQIGTSGGFQSTSYLSGASYQGATSAGLTNTTGFIIGAAVAAGDTTCGTMTLFSFGSNIWVESGVAATTTSNYTYVSGGNKSLGGTLDRVRITTVNGTDAFDGGSINILYE